MVWSLHLIEIIVFGSQGIEVGNRCTRAGRCAGDSAISYLAKRCEPYGLAPRPNTVHIDFARIARRFSSDDGLGKHSSVSVYIAGNPLRLLANSRTHARYCIVGASVA